jgi:hypothetical protein
MTHTKPQFLNFLKRANYGKSKLLFLGMNNRTRTRTNTNPNGTEASAAGRSVRACITRESESEEPCLKITLKLYV